MSKVIQKSGHNKIKGAFSCLIHGKNNLILLTKYHLLNDLTYIGCLKTTKERESVYTFHEEREFFTETKHMKTIIKNTRTSFKTFSTGKKACLGILPLHLICQYWAPELSISKILKTDYKAKSLMLKTDANNLLQFALCGLQIIEVDTTLPAKKLKKIRRKINKKCPPK